MFQLDKWYLDCVTEAGTVVCGHWATVRWGPARLRYAASLVGRSGDEHAALARYTLRPGPPPAVRGDLVEWAAASVGVSGTWCVLEPAVERLLYEGPNGSIRWSCLGPRASAVLRTGAETVRGTGYVERLTMSVPPWRLPFRTLRWGRFHGPGRTLVWIDWGEGLSRHWVFDAGGEDAGGRVCADGITLGGGRLVLPAGTTLRGGALRRTALRPLGRLVGLVPGWRAAHETKWLTRARLESGDETLEGWAVHEVVTWT